MTKASKKPTDDERLAEVLEIIFDFAKGDLTARGKLLDDDSAIDGVMAGINILGEEAQARVAENQRVNESLRNALNYAQTLIRTSPDAVVAVDPELRITEYNLLMERICGKIRDQAIGQPVDEIPILQETGEVARIQACLDARKIEPREFEYRIPGAEKKGNFESHAAPIQDHSGEILGAVLRIRDITERKQAEEQLRQASRYARTLIEAGLDPLAAVNAEGRFTDVNKATVAVTGVPREKLIGSSFLDYVDDAEKAYAVYREAFAKGMVRNVPMAIRHVSGKLTEVLFNASLFRDETGEIAGILAVARDITDQRRAEHAEEQARRDGLTNLCNHRTFYELLKAETIRTKRYKRPVSVIMLDIDHFKAVNDTYGHPAGDVVLKSLSDVLVEKTRAADRVCRYGGEEFTVILPETDTAEAVQIAGRLRKAVERHRIDIDEGKTIGITVSIGVATCPTQGETPEAVIKAADNALYAAKQAGRNQVSHHGSRRPHRGTLSKAAAGT